MPSQTAAIAAAKPSRVYARINFSPSCGVRMTFARSCQRRSEKKPPSEITRALAAPGLSHAQRSPIITPQSCVTSATGPSSSSRTKRPSACVWDSHDPDSPGSESP